MPLEGRKVPFLVFAAVLAVRGLYVVDLSRTPLVHWNLWTETDEHAYVEWSGRLAAGNWLDRPAYRAYFYWQEPYGTSGAWETWYQKNAYYSGPLYPYALAVLRVLRLPPVTAARLLQQLLAALAAAVLAAAAAARLRAAGTNRAAAMGGAAAGLLYGLYAPLVFHDSFAYRDGPVAHLSALLLALPLLGEAKEADEIKAGRLRSMAFFVGLLGGLAMLLKQTTAPLAVAALYSLSKKSPGGGEGRRIVFLGTLGLALPLAVLAGRNLACGVPPLTFDTRQAIGLAWGNGRGADGSTAPAPTMKAILDEAKGATGKTALVVLRGYRDAPAELPRLMLRKVMVFFNAFEVPDNASFYFFRDRVPLLFLLPVFPCILGVGMVGLLAALARGVLRRREFWSAVLAVATPLAASVLVQPTSRYRVGAAAPLALGAGLLVALVWEDVRRHAWRQASLPVLLASALSLVPFLPSPLPTPRHRYADAVVYATLVERFVSPEAADAELRRYEEEGEDDPAYDTGEATIESWREGDRDVARVAPEGVAPKEKRFRETGETAE